MRLTLSTERLAELTPEEMGAVVGGQTTPCPYPASEYCLPTRLVGDCAPSRMMDPCVSVVC